MKIRSFLFPFVTLLSILAISVALIAYGRGYRFDLGKNSLKPTGLVSATSDPIGAQVLIDSQLRTATNNSFNIDPGFYTARLIKEGFQPWEKKVRVQGEVVTRIDAFLFPTSPSLSAITSSGVVGPVVSPDGTKLAYIVPASQSEGINRSGVWVLDLVDKPLGLNRDARQIAPSTPDLSKAQLSWSPDSEQVLARVGTLAYLLDADQLNDPPPRVPNLETLRIEWEALSRTQELQKLQTLPQEFVSIATSSTSLLRFSPDESKILYQSTASALIPQIVDPPLVGVNSTEETRTITPGNTYLYDVKEDKNYLLGKSSSLPVISWFPTSRHLILVGRDRIEAMEYDGTNRVTVYAGPFWDAFVTPWTNPTKLVILTNLNATASAASNLYAINLR